MLEGEGVPPLKKRAFLRAFREVVAEAIRDERVRVEDHGRIHIVGIKLTGGPANGVGTGGTGGTGGKHTNGE